MDADADGVGLHVAFSDHEHGVHFHLFCALDLAVDVVGEKIGADRDGATTSHHHIAHRNQLARPSETELRILREEFL
jgi:hypothetical protein